MLEKGVIEKGEVKQEAKLVEAIREVVLKAKGEKISAKNVAVSLPEERAFLQVLQLPRMTREEAMHAVRFEADSYVPYPIDTVYLDFQIISPLYNHIDHLDILLASLPRTVVDAHIAILKKAGFTVQILETESLSTSRALIANGITPFPVMVADMGALHTNLSIFSGYSLRFTTSIQISSDGFTETISRTLSVDKKEAETLKQTYGLRNPRNPKQQEVFDALIPIATDLAEQIRKYIDYYESHASHQHLGKQANQIRRIMLSGGGANLPGLPEFLAKRFRIEVVIANPWVNIFPSPLKETPALTFAKAQQYATVLGLALRAEQISENYENPSV